MRNVKVWGARISDGSKGGLCERGVSETSGPLSAAAPPPFPQGAPAASRTQPSAEKRGSSWSEASLT